MINRNDKKLNFDIEEKEILLKNNIEKLINYTDLYEDFNCDIYFKNEDLNKIIIAVSVPIFVRNIKLGIDYVPNKEWSELLPIDEIISIPKIRNKINLNGKNKISNSNNYIENNNIENGHNKEQDMINNQDNLSNY